MKEGKMFFQDAKVMEDSAKEYATKVRDTVVVGDRGFSLYEIIHDAYVAGFTKAYEGV